MCVCDLVVEEVCDVGVEEDGRGSVFGLELLPHTLLRPQVHVTARPAHPPHPTHTDIAPSAQARRTLRALDGVGEACGQARATGRLTCWCQPASRWHCGCGPCTAARHHMASHGITWHTTRLSRTLGRGLPRAAHSFDLLPRYPTCPPGLLSAYLVVDPSAVPGLGESYGLLVDAHDELGRLLEQPTLPLLPLRLLAHLHRHNPRHSVNTSSPFLFLLAWAEA